MFCLSVQAVINEDMTADAVSLQKENELLRQGLEMYRELQRVRQQHSHDAAAFRNMSWELFTACASWIHKHIMGHMYHMDVTHAV